MLIIHHFPVEYFPVQLISGYIYDCGSDDTETLLRVKSKFIACLLLHVHFETALLAFIDKYGVPTNQLTWLYEAFLVVSMNKIPLWIRVCADDWAAESAVKASNDINEKMTCCGIVINRVLTVFYWHLLFTLILINFHFWYLRRSLACYLRILCMKLNVTFSILFTFFSQLIFKIQQHCSNVTHGSCRRCRRCEISQ